MQLAYAMRRIAVFLQALLTRSAFATRPSGRFDFLNSANNLTSAIEYNSSQIPKFSKMDGLNPVLATATEIQSLLENGAITSVQLIDTFLAQIKKHNRAGLELRALSSVPSRVLLLARAEMLDKERSAGKTRSPFHGIPITLTDAIITDLSLGMSSEVGSYAFRDAVPKQNAEIVDVLLERGLIIIGKASLTEFCGQKGQGVKTGWSATNGQSQSAYVKGGVARDDLIYGYTTPGGSSSGSAIGVSAGFTPLSCGTEHDGSAIGPANRAALYAVKMTHGSVSTKGVFRITSSMDCLAGMAKSTADLAVLLEMMLTEEARKHLPADGYKSALVHSWDGISIGFVDPCLWRLPASICPPDEDSIAQQEAAIHAAMKKMSDLGARVVYPVELPPYSDFDFDTVSDYEFTETYPEFTSNFKEPPAKNLAELIEFNKQHADLELPVDSPSQSFLEDALKSRITSEEYTAAKAQMRKLGGPDGIDRAMGEHQVDVIVAPSHSPISSVSAAAGYPIATVPLGMIEKYNVPFGISIVSTAFAEDKLLRFTSAFEATFPQRTPPSMLQEEHTSL